MLRAPTTLSSASCAIWKTSNPNSTSIPPAAAASALRSFARSIWRPHALSAAAVCRPRHDKHHTQDATHEPAHLLTLCEIQAVPPTADRLQIPMLLVTAKHTGWRFVLSVGCGLCKRENSGPSCAKTLVVAISATTGIKRKQNGVLTTSVFLQDANPFPGSGYAINERQSIS